MANASARISARHRTTSVVGFARISPEGIRWRRTDGEASARNPLRRRRWHHPGPTTQVPDCVEARGPSEGAFDPPASGPGGGTRWSVADPGEETNDASGDGVRERDAGPPGARATPLAVGQ